MYMQKFWELFEKSVIITGSLALVIVIGAVIMAVKGVILPEWYLAALMLVLGFFFGSKAGVSNSKKEG